MVVVGGGGFWVQDIGFMGRLIRERILEKDKGLVTSPATFDHLTGGEVVYPNAK